MNFSDIISEKDKKLYYIRCNEKMGLGNICVQRKGAKPKFEKKKLSARFTQPGAKFRNCFLSIQHNKPKLRAGEDYLS